MNRLDETNMLSMVSLFRQIIQNNPPIKVLNLTAFSHENWRENICELLLEILLSSNVDKITDLTLSKNKTWFNDYS